MKFSIIIPMYNCEDKLHISMDSILGQEYEDYELILIDDSSSDNTYEEAKKYQDNNNRIKLLKNESGKGPSDGRNRGLEEAEGDYILFCDADDQLENDTLKKLDKILENKYDIVFFGYWDARFEKNNIIKKNIHMAEQRIIKTNEEFKELYKELDGLSFTYPVWNKAYSRKFINNCKARFPKETSVAEDFIFNLQLYKQAENVYISDECFYNYIQHSKSITSTFNKNKIDGVEYVYKYAVNFMEQWNPEMANIIRNRYINDVSVYVNNMFNKDSTINNKEKYDIVTKIIDKKSIQECIKQTKCSSFRNKLMSVLLRRKCRIFILLTGKLARLRG